MKRPPTLTSLDRDGRLVIAASAVRAMDYGFLSVFLGVYLSLLGYNALQAGIVFSGIMAGGALSNVVASWRGDTIGRRRMLVVMSALMVIGGALFAVSSSVVVLVLVGLIAMTTATGGDRTAFVSLDTAILAQTTAPSQRTLVFSWYNLVGFIAKAIGSLLIAVPPLLQSTLGVAEIASFKAMFGVYALVAAGGILLYARLSPRVEAPPAADGRRVEAARQYRGIIAKLAGLFAMDATGGGFMVRSFLSYWFVTQFGASENTVAGIFFGGQILNAVSVWLAAPVAMRLGLINTMAFSQGVSNALMIGVALSPSLWVAALLFLLRELSNDMDIPTRQSYTMAIVPPEARTAMASVTNLGRNVAQTVSPTMAGYVAQLTFLGAPFLIGSGIKLLYNALLYLQFRSIKAPEERVTGKATVSNPSAAQGESASDG